MKVDGLEHPVTRRPAPGVVCAAELPGLEGYQLTIGPCAPVVDRASEVTARHGFEIRDNDPELTAALIDDSLADHLACLHRTERWLVLADGEVRVLGGDVPPADETDLAEAVARLCVRPVRLARRVARLFRSFGGVASALRWDTSAFAVELPTDPRVRIDWPRRPGLITRMRAEAGARGAFHVIDQHGAEPPDGPRAALDVPDVAAERYVCVARTDDALAHALDRLGPALALLGAAIPHAVEVGDSAVEVHFLGFEQQHAAIDPAVDLVRALAGPGFAPGPYR